MVGQSNDYLVSGIKSYMLSRDLNKNERLDWSVAESGQNWDKTGQWNACSKFSFSASGTKRKGNSRVNSGGDCFREFVEIVKTTSTVVSST